MGNIFTLDFFNLNKHAQYMVKLSEYFGEPLDKVVNTLVSVDYDNQSYQEILLDMVKSLNIDLNKMYHEEPTQLCRHATTVTDNLASIKRDGLLNLRQMLEQKTELSDFLAYHNIVINVRDKKLIYKGRGLPIYNLDELEHSIEQEYMRCNSIDLYEKSSNLKSHSYHNEIRLLHTKLYYDDCETEAFLRGDKDDIYGYSTVRMSPEILLNIGKVINRIDRVPMTYLQDAWADREGCKSYILEFNVPIKQFSKSTLKAGFDEFYEFDGLAEKFGYSYEDYESDTIPTQFYINLYVLRQLAIKALDGTSKEFCQIKSNTVIPGSDIRVYYSENVKEKPPMI